jgi:formylmethanofuran dehydrogenase subunit E
MKQEQREALRELATAGKALGPSWDEILEASFLIHGHVCGGMPLGFRAGVAALKALSSEREADMAHLAFVETGTGHAAGCFADGVQMATGCTFGKGLLERTQYGKWAVNLVDPATRQAVRVSVKPEVMKAALQSPFVKLRHQGVPPTEVPLDVSRPLVQGLMAKTDGDLFTMSGTFEYPLGPAAPACFDTVICTGCGELVAENKVRMKGSRPVCLPCSGYGR